MAFVNEYVSQEDIEKYGLDALYNRYEDVIAVHLPQQGFQHHWTIDRERECWFTFIRREEDPNQDYGYTREHIFILNYQNHNIEVRLWKSEDSQTNIYITPFIVIWELLSLTPDLLDNLSIEKIKLLLQDALEVYGKDGRNKKVKNVIVEFRD